MNSHEKTPHLKFFGIGRITPYIGHVKKMLSLMALCIFAVSIADIITPLFQKYTLNHFIAEKTFDTLPYFIILYLAVIITSSFLNYIACSYAMSSEIRIDQMLRKVGFAHLQTLSFSYFNRNSVGYIHARLMSDTSKIGELFSWTLIDSVWRLTYLIGAIAVMFYLNAKLTLAVLTIVPLLLVLFAFFQKKLIHVNREIREINSKITGNFNEGITGAKTVKSLGIENSMTERFCGETRNMRSKSIRASRIRGLFSGVMNLGTSAAIAIVLWKGGYIAQSEVGTFSVFMSYAQGMLEPIRWLVDAFSTLITTQVNIERFTNLLAEKSDVTDSPEVIEKYGDSINPKRQNWEEIHGSVEFCDVTFKYPDGDENVLEHFNLSVPVGTHVAIVGETGAGKSTLVNLVCRFYEPTEGSVLIDGKDARERSQLWLHSSIGYVLQTPHLFSGTIRENLLMGNPDASEDEIYRALKTANALSVVEKLEKGLDTDVGEGGDMLSTGEKQLISFARAVISDPKILILDEATASVDTITEAKIQDALESVADGRTAFIIAHRLSTVKNSDVILAVKDGKIVERGTHGELIALRGYYYELYTRQYKDETTSKLLDE